MLEPPVEPPPALRTAIADADAVGVRRHAVTAILAYLAVAGFLPLVMWNGIRKWDAVLGVFFNAIIMAVGRVAPRRARAAPESLPASATSC